MANAVPEAFEDRLLRRIPLEIAVAAALLGAGAALLFDPATGLFVLAGGLVSALGFAWLKRSLTRFLTRNVQGARRAGVLLYALRVVLICAIFFLIILLYPKKILAFVAGFSTVVPVSLAVAIRGLLQLKKWKA
jgi:ATP synthase I chain